MSKISFKLCVIIAIVLAGAIRSNGQNALPEVFEQGTVTEQFKYLEARSRIYEDYRAIREDMFRVISKNTMDTLTNAKSRIKGLISHTTALDSRIDSLKMSLEDSKTELQKMIRTKNSINVLGLEVRKAPYNTFMWTILAALTFLLIVGYLTFKQNRAVTIRTKKDLNELKAEFEEYRKKTRLEREKMTFDHFNEIKKLKGK